MSERAPSGNAAEGAIDLARSAQALASSSPAVRIAELQLLSEAVARKRTITPCSELDRLRTD